MLRMFYSTLNSGQMVISFLVYFQICFISLGQGGTVAQW